MDKIAFWQFYERIGNSGFKENHYFDISRKDKKRLKILKIIDKLAFITLICLSAFVSRNNIICIVFFFGGIIIESLIKFLLYFIIFKKAEIIIFNRQSEIITNKITFWQYYKYTTLLADNNAFDVSRKDKKRIFILNICGFIFTLTLSLFVVILLRLNNDNIFFGIFIATIIIEQLITLPFHYKIYKNIELTEYNI